MTTLHWQMRNYAQELRQDGRLAVLLMLTMHANLRLRCWPSVDLLATETGWALASITAAKKWLIEHNAMILVPFNKRIDEETKLPIRQHVYQLTGVIDIDGKTWPYLYMTPEAKDSVKAILDTLPKASKVSPTEVSSNEVSPTSAKDIPGSKGIPDNTHTDKTPDPKTKTERKRDPIFDVIGSELFSIKPADPVGRSEAGRIARVKAELLSIDPNIAPADIIAFVCWYKASYPNASLPNDAAKVAKHYRDSKAAARPTAPQVSQAKPDDPKTRSDVEFI